MHEDVKLGKSPTYLPYLKPSFVVNRGMQSYFHWLLFSFLWHLSSLRGTDARPRLCPGDCRGLKAGAELLPSTASPDLSLQLLTAPRPGEQQKEKLGLLFKYKGSFRGGAYFSGNSCALTWVCISAVKTAGKIISAPGHITFLEELTCSALR